MALKGKIDDFGIADIFQLIAQQQRTGILSVQSRNRAAEIFFVKGMISKANPLYLSPKRTPLGDCLVKAQLLSEESLQGAMRQQDETLKSLEKVVIDLQLITKGQLQTVNERLIIDTLYDTLQWKEGDYEFVIKDIEHDEQLGDPLSVEYLLLDVLRMIDEASDLSKRIPEESMVFHRVSQAAAESDSSAIEQQFGSHERIVFDLVDGTNNVKAITEKSLLGRYSANKALVTLLDAGVVASKPGAGPSSVPKILFKRRIFRQLLYGAIPIIIVMFLIYLRLMGELPHTLDQTSLAFAKAAIAKSQVPRIRSALNVYFLETGRFPQTLKELSLVRVISPSTLHYPPGMTYRYQLQSDGSYRLE